MNTAVLQSALREWRTLMAKPTTAVVLICVAALLAILGPFGTADRMALAPRFAYWAVMATTTFSAGFLANQLIADLMPERLAPPWRIAAQAVATTLGITPIITALNFASFGFFPSLAEWPELLAQFAAIALITTVIFQAIAQQFDKSDPSPVDTPPALLQRLALDKRGALVSLSSEDHYTRIRTTLGEELVLIRLADAISEAAPAAGLRVHRSHWIATTQVTSAAKKGDGAVLSMTSGDDIPVSRSHMTAIREAGLLPS